MANGIVPYIVGNPKNICSAAPGTRHIYIVSDGTLARNDYDISAVSKIYRDMGADCIPYHYVIKHCESDTKDMVTGEPLHYDAGTVFKTRDLNFRNGMTDENSESADRRISPDDVVICTTLTSGSWLTNGASTAVAASLKYLLRYLMQELSVTPDYIHNWYNYGDGDWAFNEESFDRFDSELRAEISVKSGRIGVVDNEDNTKLILKSLYPEGASLNTIARICAGGQSASRADVQAMKEYLVSVNPNVWSSVESTNKSTAFINIPSGNVASVIINNLKAQQLYQDMNEVIYNESTNTLWSEEIYQQAVDAYKDPADVHRPGDIQTQRTTRGGKSEMLWRYTFLRLPGYHNALLQFDKQDGSKECIQVNFMISPSDFSESRSNNISNIKTLGGWVGQKLGKNPIQVRFTGHMLDVKENLERHRFLEMYKDYIEDRKDGDYSYYNNYSCKLIIEGRDYYGYVVGLSFSKDAQKPFLYSYNVSFIAYNDKKIYDPNQALFNNMDEVQDREDSPALNGIQSDVDEIYKFLSELVAQGLLDATTAAYIKGQIESYGKGTVEYENAVKSAMRNLKYYQDSQDWSKQYLEWFLNKKTGQGAPYITSYDVWVFPDATPKTCHCIALIDKMTGNQITNSSTNADIRWDQPHIVSLLSKKILRDSSQWLSNNRPKYSESEAMTRGLLCAVCDYIHGRMDSCQADSMSESQILDNILYLAADKSVVSGYHWSYKHIYSLAAEGVIGTPIDSYWLENPDGDVSVQYTLALLYKAYNKQSAQQPVESFLPKDGNEAIMKPYALKYIDTVTGGVTSDDRADASVRWDTVHIYSLERKSIIRTLDSWIIDGTNTPSYQLSSKLSIGLALGLCDLVGGAGDFPWMDDKTEDEIYQYFVGLGYDYGPHWSQKHVYSLINKGVIDKNNRTDMEYWLHDPEYPCSSNRFVEIISART